MNFEAVRRIGGCSLLAAWLVVAGPGFARGQVLEPSPEEKFQELSELDKLAEEKEKKNRPPFEFFQSQVAPFDTLPYYRPNHWFTMAINMRSNASNYDGILRTAAEVNGRSQLPLLEMSHAMSYRRDALLPKEQTVTRSLQIFATGSEKRLLYELQRPGMIRPDDVVETNLLKLEPHQMLIPVLGPEPSNYNAWASMLATVPTSGDRDPATIDKGRYYRLALPQEPDRPNLSPHPLTWTTTSHLVWDGFNPEALTSGPLGQQRAILDWLHWGGQLIVVAAGPNVAPLQDSFLGPYLPALSSGRSTPLTTADLSALSESYRPPIPVDAIDYPLTFDQARQALVEAPPLYGPAESIAPTEAQPLIVAGLEPKDEPGIVSYPVGDGSGTLLAVERRVGRGRLLMLAVNPADPALVGWRGLDTFVRRLLLRRPQEVWGGEDRLAFQLLSGPQVSWVRYLTRDLGAKAVEPESDPNAPMIQGELIPPTDPVAAWTDSGSELPTRVRETLEQASGITIPGSTFVLKVIVAYLIALVPLNWLVCRFLVRRKELAWVVVPILALGFAYGVERGAAYDVGFDSACDEIDVLELQGGYNRGHLTRMASLYSSGRARYEVAYPDDPSALVLPMRAVQQVRGEADKYSTFQSTPFPALVDFAVEPRSLAMFRSEAMVELGGGIELAGGFDDGTIVNGTDLVLLDAVLIDVDRGEKHWLGRLAPWPRTEAEMAAGDHEVRLEARPSPPPGRLATDVGDQDTRSVDGGFNTEDDLSWVQLRSYLSTLETYQWSGPQEAGEVRLVAWTRDVHPGQRLDPAVDRHRGLRMVVAHLRFGMPDPASTTYYNPTEPRPDPDDPDRP